MIHQLLINMRNKELGDGWQHPVLVLQPAGDVQVVGPAQLKHCMVGPQLLVVSNQDQMLAACC